MVGLLSDPGWPFVLAGVVILCAWALIPAAADRDGLREQLQDLERRRELAAARTAEHRRTIEHLARAVTAPPDEAGRLDPADQETLRRLSMALLRRMPAGQSEMVVDGQPPPPLVERLVPWDEPPSDLAGVGVARSSGDRVLEDQPSRLERLVSGPGRLWVAGLAVFSVFTGLLLGPSAIGAGAAGGDVRRGRRGLAGRHQPCRPAAAAELPRSVDGRNHPGRSIESRSAPETAGRIGHTLAPPPPGVVEDPPQSGPADSAARTESDVIVRVNAMEQAMNGAVLEMPTNVVTDEVLDAASDGPGVLLDEATPSLLESAPAGPVAMEDDEEDEDFDYFDDEDDAEDEDDEDDGFWYEDDEEESDDEEEDEEDGDDDDDDEADEDEDEDDEDDEDDDDDDEYEYSDDDEDEEYEYEDEEDAEDEDEDEED